MGAKRQGRDAHTHTHTLKHTHTHTHKHTQKGTDRDFAVLCSAELELLRALSKRCADRIEALVLVLVAVVVVLHHIVHVLGLELEMATGACQAAR